MQKGLFIHAISQRCGHNFLTEVLREKLSHKIFIHKNHEVIVPSILAEKRAELNSKNFIRNKKAKIKELEIAADSYCSTINTKDAYIFKNSLLSSRYNVDLFPDSKHIILTRNLYDLFTSYEKSIYNFRKIGFKEYFKKFIRPIYSFYVLYKWSKGIERTISELKQIECKYLLVTYESLMTIKGQRRLFNFLDLEITIQETIKPVNVNSSFSEKNIQWNKPSKNIGDTSKRFENAPLWLRLMIILKLKNLSKELNDL
jgi:hypothetical protein